MIAKPYQTVGQNLSCAELRHPTCSKKSFRRRRNAECFEVSMWLLFTFSTARRMRLTNKWRSYWLLVKIHENIPNFEHDSSSINQYQHYLSCRLLSVVWARRLMGMPPQGIHHRALVPTGITAGCSVFSSRKNSDQAIGIEYRDAKGLQPPQK